MLTCEVDREDATVHWYKDGQEVEESAVIVLEKEGLHHRLVLRAAQPSDGGEFQCVVGDERAYFTVTITGESSYPTCSCVLSLLLPPLASLCY